MRYMLMGLAALLAGPVAAQTITISPPASWQACAKEGEMCKATSGTLLRYGAGTKYSYRVVKATTMCDNATLGDPVEGVVKTCSVARAAVALPTPKPIPTPVPTPTPTPTPVPSNLTAREKIGVNVSLVNYWSNESNFANQAYRIAWLSHWQGVDKATLRPDGMPKSVARDKAIQGFPMPPTAAYTGEDATTVCTWSGKGEMWIFGDANGIELKPNSFEFRWANKKPPQAWLEIRYSDAADPMRDLDCRLKGLDKTVVYDPGLLSYLKPFGTLRFLDWSRANSSPAVVEWNQRSTTAGVGYDGEDGMPVEDMIGLANTNGSSPWFTVPWGATPDYHRQMAKLVHATVPAGRKVYVELSNEVWNYSFGQAHVAQAEGLERKLSDNGFQANLHRYAQKITEVMPIWAEVFKDRPADLVRIMATQSGNPWTGEVIMDWNKNAIVPHIDAIAIAPYFFADATTLTADHDTNMRLLEEASIREIAGPVKAYTTLADKFGKRLVAYEGGQHQLDPDNLDRMAKMERDPRMEGIYRNYRKGWDDRTGDLFTFYAATGSISRYGAWGLREYAGQPIAETPKLRGVLN